MKDFRELPRWVEVGWVNHQGSIALVEKLLRSDGEFISLEIQQYGKNSLTNICMDKDTTRELIRLLEAALGDEGR